MTLERLTGLSNLESPIIVCNEEHRFITAEQLRETKIEPKSIILEPFGRNTCPAITLAAFKSIEDGQDPILLVLPSDHKIEGIYFLKTIEAAVDFAERGNLIAFGIHPQNAQTGFGYIKSKVPLIKNGLKGEIIEKFIEKPSKDIAMKLIQDKKYSWNSGIYLFKASAIIKRQENTLQKF